MRASESAIRVEHDDAQREKFSGMTCPHRSRATVRLTSPCFRSSTIRPDAAPPPCAAASPAAMLPPILSPSLPRQLADIARQASLIEIPGRACARSARSTGSPPASRSVASCNRYRQIPRFGVTLTSLEKRCCSVLLAQLRTLEMFRCGTPLPAKDSRKKPAIARDSASSTTPHHSPDSRAKWIRYPGTTSKSSS